jgi:hypothetical protein
MIAEVYFLRKEETLFHTDTKVSNSFDLFAWIWIDFKLWYPKRVHKLLSVFNDIIKYKVQENEKLNPH